MWIQVGNNIESGDRVGTYITPTRHDYEPPTALQPAWFKILNDHLPDFQSESGRFVTYNINSIFVKYWLEKYLTWEGREWRGDGPP